MRRPMKGKLHGPPVRSCPGRGPSGPTVFTARTLPLPLPLPLLLLLLAPFLASSVPSSASGIAPPASVTSSSSPPPPSPLSPSPRIIPLERRRWRRRRSRQEGDKASSTSLRSFEVESAFFAQLEVVGPGPGETQTVDVLVDTGSAHLLIPSSLCQPDSCNTGQGPVLQKLDLETAGASLVACSDPRCQGACSREMLRSKGLIDRGEGMPDATCGPHGGICQPAAAWSSPSSPSSASASPACLVLDSYADGSWAIGPLATVPEMRLAGLSAHGPLFAAVAEAAPSFFEAPQGGGIMGMAMGREEGRRRKGDCGTPCLAPFVDTLFAQQQQQSEPESESQPRLTASQNATNASPSPLPDRFSMVGGGGGGGGSGGDRGSSSSSAALLILGAGGGEPATEHLHQGPLRYSPMLQPWGYYTVAVLGLEITMPRDAAASSSSSSSAANANATQEEDKAGADEEPPPQRVVGRHMTKKAAGAILDTGTTGLFFPRDSLAFFQATLQQHFCHVPHVCSSEQADGAVSQQDKGQERHQRLRGRRRRVQARAGVDIGGGDNGGSSTTSNTIFDGEEAWVAWDEDSLAQLPTLALLLRPDGGRRGDPPVRLELGPEQYLMRAYDEEAGVHYYALAIGAGGDDEEDEGVGYLLGEAMLNGYFVEFDRERKRVGFAPAAPFSSLPASQ